MEKVIIIGKVVEVAPVQTSEKGTAQTIVINQKRFDSNTGEEKGDANYPVVFFGDKLEKLSPAKMLGKVVECGAWLNSNARKGEGEHEGKMFWNIYLSGTDLKERAAAKS